MSSGAHVVPYLIALAFGAAFVAAYQYFGVAAVVPGLIGIAAYAFGPPLPGGRHEQARLGANDYASAMSGFAFAGAAGWAVAMISPARTSSNDEAQLAQTFFQWGGWACVIGGVAWGALCARPRR